MQSINLKPLQDFVQRELILSEETKSVLQSECDEAKFALKSWPQETITHKEVDKSFCTCDEGEHHLQITEIDRAILQKQELKEKLKTNLLKERSRSRKPDVREIYMPNSKSSTRLKRSCSISQSRLENRQESRRRSSEKNGDENSQKELTKRRSFSSNRRMEIESKPSNTDSKKLPLLTQNNSKVKLKTESQTNYILANKQNLTRNTKPSENKNRLPPLMKAESTLCKNFTKMQIQQPKELIAEKLHQNENCPLHGNNINPKIVDRIAKSVDAIEGLDRHGVPSSLVKVLKVYHSYLKGKFSDTEAKEKKSEEASNKFIMEFNEMCIERKNQNSKSDKLPSLVKGFIEILGELYDKKSIHIQRNDLKTKYSNLDSKFKNMALDKKENRKSKIHENSRDLLHKRGWMSNGIWNDLCIPNFEGMFKVLCIRYSSRAQLVSFFDAVQELQRAKYQEVLVHYLLQKVIPEAKKFLEPDSPEFSEVYKMCFTIIQILNPRAPVLVRTD